MTTKGTKRPATTIDLKISKDPAHVEQFSAFLAKENINLIVTHSKSLGEDVTTTLLMAFVTNVVDKIIMRELDRPEDVQYSDEELYDLVYKRFAAVKLNLQDAIAEGFRRAMTEYSGLDIDYYCNMVPVPPDTGSERSN